MNGIVNEQKHFKSFSPKKEILRFSFASTTVFSIILKYFDPEVITKNNNSNNKYTNNNTDKNTNINNNHNNQIIVMLIIIVET